MSLSHVTLDKRCAALCVVALVWVVGVWLLGTTAAHAEETSVTVEVASTPPLEHVRPNADLAHVTFTILLHGTPLSQGHIKLRLTAPPRPQVLATGFPRVEGTPLLELASEFTDGTFTLQYFFPIRGAYTFDLDIAPGPGSPAFPPTSLRKTVHLSEDPAVARHAWLLIVGLFVLGGITGVIFARSAAARERLVSRAIMGPLVLCCGGALASVSTAAAEVSHTKSAPDAVPGHQVMRGDEGWEIEVRASPMPATVGRLVQLDIWLRQDDAVFAGLTAVSITATNQEDGEMVIGTHILARQGHTSQSLQLFDGAPHTITVTARPSAEQASAVAPLTAVLSLDVVALHPPLAVQIRMMAIFLGVLVVGMVVGFFVPRTYKEQTGA